MARLVLFIDFCTDIYLHILGGVSKKARYNKAAMPGQGTLVIVMSIRR